MVSEMGSAGDFGSSLMPEQYYPLLKRHAPMAGEFRLLFAVLEDAMRCYLTTMDGRTRDQRARFREVDAWFNGSDAGNGGPGGLFAFETLCELLGIEPAVVRNRLKSIRVSELPTRRQRRMSPGLSFESHQRRSSRRAGVAVKH